MILIITHRQDYTVDFVVEKLNQRKIPYRRLNCEDIQLSEYCFEFSPQISYSLLGCDHFDSIWFRRTKLPDVSDSLAKAEREFILKEYYSLIQNILLTIDARMLSNPTNAYAAENKMYQLSVAGRIGFKIPSTVVTNSRQLTKAFFDRVSKTAVIKSISENKIVDGDDQRIIFTNALTQEYVDRLDQFDLTPSIVQANVPKQYEVRTTVVDESVFSAKIVSQDFQETKVDWRRKPIPVEAYELPDEINEKCTALVKALGLSFGAIDLIRDVDGDYYFLEINPNGQWAWIEAETGLPISEAIIKYLV